MIWCTIFLIPFTHLLRPYDYTSMVIHEIWWWIFAYGEWHILTDPFISSLFTSGLRPYVICKPLATNGTTVDILNNESIIMAFFIFRCLHCMNKCQLISLAKTSGSLHLWDSCGRLVRLQYFDIIIAKTSYIAREYGIVPINTNDILHNPDYA